MDDPRVELLSALLDDELDSQERVEAEELLRANPAARKLFEQLRGVRIKVAASPDEEAPIGFAGAVLMRIADEVGDKPPTLEELAATEETETPEEPVEAAREEEVRIVYVRPPVYRDVRAAGWPVAAIAASLLAIALWRGGDGRQIAQAEPDQSGAAAERATRGAASPRQRGRDDLASELNSGRPTVRAMRESETLRFGQDNRVGSRFAPESSTASEAVSSTPARASGEANVALQLDAAPTEPNVGFALTGEEPAAPRAATSDREAAYGGGYGAAAPSAAGGYGGSSPENARGLRGRGYGGAAGGFGGAGAYGNESRAATPQLAAADAPDESLSEAASEAMLVEPSAAPEVERLQEFAAPLAANGANGVTLGDDVLFVDLETDEPEAAERSLQLILAKNSFVISDEVDDAASESADGALNESKRELPPGAAVSNFIVQGSAADIGAAVQELQQQTNLFRRVDLVAAKAGPAAIQPVPQPPQGELPELERNSAADRITAQRGQATELGRALSTQEKTSLAQGQAAGAPFDAWYFQSPLSNSARSMAPVYFNNGRLAYGAANDSLSRGRTARRALAQESPGEAGEFDGDEVEAKPSLAIVQLRMALPAEERAAAVEAASPQP